MSEAKAAGLALVLPDGMALFLKRASGSDFESTWCLPGGSIEGDERPIDAALRETREETGWIKPEEDADEPEIVTGASQNGYATFKLRVNSAFIPTLDHEHTAWAWAPLDDPPQPVHPGLEKTLMVIAVDAAFSFVEPFKSMREGDPDAHLLRAMKEAVAAGGGRLEKPRSYHAIAGDSADVWGRRDPPGKDNQPGMVTSPNSGIPAAAMLREEAEDALIAGDMTPAEWKGLVGGLLQFFAEEAMEPDHAEDDGELIKSIKIKFFGEGGEGEDAALDATQTEISERIAREIKRGHDPKQAAAIAFSQLGQAQDMEPEGWRGLIRGLLKFFAEESGEPEHAMDSKPKTLYVNRPLKNAAEVIAWARAAGFQKTLPADDMHVSVAFSRTPVDWMKVGSDDYYAPNGKASADLTVPKGGARMLERFGEDQDAVVLLFNSSRLSWRHEAIKASGASWDWPEYQPHITITYDGSDVDLSKIEPYKGELVFGPEEFEEVQEKWMEKVKLAGDAALTDAEKAHGKLSERQESAIGTPGSEKREEMPSSVFLQPASKKYPVKEKREGGWHYSRKLLLAAARRARMNGNESLASRADEIRAREFGGAEDDYLIPTGETGEIEIDHAHDGPWLSCMRKDGRLMYMNKNLPSEADVDDNGTVNVADVLLSHEVPEWKDLENLLKVFQEGFGREPDEQERKVLYQGAHGRSGTPSEKEFCEENGIDWKKWSAWCRGEETKCEKGPFTNEPDDADVKPIPHGHGDLAATDSALVLALDKDSVRNLDRDGRMHVDEANICKACISPYRGSEIPDYEQLGLDPDRVYKLFRDPDEIEKAAETSNGIQLLQRHVPVDVNDHKPYDIVGTTGSKAKFEHPFLKNSLHFWTRQAIEDINSQKKRELSPGYHYKADMTPGTFEGEPYDGVMRGIVFNHVAQVEDGRQGKDVIVGDSMDGITWTRLESELAEFAMVAA